MFSISPPESLCPFCSTEEDSLSHLFFRCIFARVVWRSSFWPFDSFVWSSLSLPNWIKAIIHPHSSLRILLADIHLFQIFDVVLCDLLWFSKNKVVHKGVIPDIKVLANSISRTTIDQAIAWKSSSLIAHEFWSPFLASSFKVNFDTAIRKQFSV
jgi:hypothetical protein